MELFLRTIIASQAGDTGSGPVIGEPLFYVVVASVIIFLFFPGLLATGAITVNLPSIRTAQTTSDSPPSTRATAAHGGDFIEETCSWPDTEGKASIVPASQAYPPSSVRSELPGPSMHWDHEIFKILTGYDLTMQQPQKLFAMNNGLKQDDIAGWLCGIQSSSHMELFAFRVRRSFPRGKPEGNGSWKRLYSRSPIEVM